MTQPPLDRAPSLSQQRVGATRPRHGHDGDLRLGQCLWTGRSSGAYDLPSNAVGTPCSAWPPRAGRCEVTRPVARANRNAVTGASDGWVSLWGKPRCIDPSGAVTDAMTHLGQALMHWSAGPPDRAQLGPLRDPPPGPPRPGRPPGPPGAPPGPPAGDPRQGPIGPFILILSYLFGGIPPIAVGPPGAPGPPGGKKVHIFLGI